MTRPSGLLDYSFLQSVNNLPPHVCQDDREYNLFSGQGQINALMDVTSSQRKIPEKIARGSTLRSFGETMQWSLQKVPM
jgi:hypothetical protein